MKRKSFIAIIAFLAVAFIAACSGETPVDRIVLSDTVLSMEVGDSVTVTATVEPSDADYDEVTWTSANTSIATVNNGTITAVAAGQTSITVAAGGEYAYVAVTVSAPATDPDPDPDPDPEPVVAEEVQHDVTDIEVAYGTSQADALAHLPGSVVVVDSEGESHTMSLTWSVSGYDAETAGDYTATGIFSLPANVEQGDISLEVSAVITVLEDDMIYIVEIGDVAGITVPLGSSFGYVVDRLPLVIDVIDNEGNTHEFDLTWHEGDYDGETSGVYHIVGTFELPEGVSAGSLDLEVTAEVTVDEERPALSTYKIDYEGYKRLLGNSDAFIISILTDVLGQAGYSDATLRIWSNTSNNTGDITFNYNGESFINSGEISLDLAANTDMEIEFDLSVSENGSYVIYFELLDEDGKRIQQAAAVEWDVNDELPETAQIFRGNTSNVVEIAWGTPAVGQRTWSAEGTFVVPFDFDYQLPEGARLVSIDDNNNNDLYTVTIVVRGSVSPDTVAQAGLFKNYSFYNITAPLTIGDELLLTNNKYVVPVTSDFSGLFLESYTISLFADDMLLGERSSSAIEDGRGGFLRAATVQSSEFDPFGNIWEIDNSLEVPNRAVVTYTVTGLEPQVVEVEFDADDINTFNAMSVSDALGEAGKTVVVEGVVAATSGTANTSNKVWLQDEDGKTIVVNLTSSPRIAAGNHVLIRGTVSGNNLNSASVVHNFAGSENVVVEQVSTVDELVSAYQHNQNPMRYTLEGAEVYYSGGNVFLVSEGYGINLRFTEAYLNRFIPNNVGVDNKVNFFKAVYPAGSELPALTFNVADLSGGAINVNEVAMASFQPTNENVLSIVEGQVDGLAENWIEALEAHILNVGDNVTQTFNLPTSVTIPGLTNANRTIRWTSSNLDLIDTVYGNVKIPGIDANDAVVTLTAELVNADGTTVVVDTYEVEIPSLQTLVVNRINERIATALGADKDGLITANKSYTIVSNTSIFGKTYTFELESNNDVIEVDSNNARRIRVTRPTDTNSETLVSVTGLIKIDQGDDPDLEISLGSNDFVVESIHEGKLDTLEDLLEANSTLNNDIKGNISLPSFSLGTGYTVRLTSSNDSIFTAVHADGHLTGGTVVLPATNDTTVTMTATIIYRLGQSDEFTVGSRSIDVDVISVMSQFIDANRPIGDKEEIRLGTTLGNFGSDSNYSIGGRNYAVTWTSSENWDTDETNPTFTVAENGTIRFPKANSQTITFTAELERVVTGTNEVIGSTSFTVTIVSQEEMITDALEDSVKTSMVKGTTQNVLSQLPASLTEFTNRNITWTTSNPHVVSVSGNTLTAANNGTATVTANYRDKDGGRYSMEFTITVTDAPEEPYYESGEFTYTGTNGFLPGPVNTSAGTYYSFTSTFSNGLSLLWNEDNPHQLGYIQSNFVVYDMSRIDFELAFPSSLHGFTVNVLYSTGDSWNTLDAIVLGEEDEDENVITEFTYDTDLTGPAHIRFELVLPSDFDAEDDEQDYDTGNVTISDIEIWATQREIVTIESDFDTPTVWDNGQRDYDQISDFGTLPGRTTIVDNFGNEYTVNIEWNTIHKSPSSGITGTYTLRGQVTSTLPEYMDGFATDLTNRVEMTVSVSYRTAIEVVPGDKFVYAYDNQDLVSIMNTINSEVGTITVRTNAGNVVYNLVTDPLGLVGTEMTWHLLEFEGKPGLYDALLFIPENLFRAATGVAHGEVRVFVKVNVLEIPEAVTTALDALNTEFGGLPTSADSEWTDLTNLAAELDNINVSIADTLAEGAVMAQIEALENYSKYTDLAAQVFDLEVTEKVVPVIDEIDLLPAVSSLELTHDTAVENARASYEALRADLQAEVTNIDKLVALEERLVELEAIKEFTDAVSALPTVGAIELTDKEDVEAARALYNGLAEDLQEEVTDEESELVALEERIVQLETLSDFVEAMADLTAGALTLEDEADVLAARALFEGLDASLQGDSSISDEVTKLADLEAQILVLAREAVEALIDDLPTPSAITLNDKAQVEAARDAFDALEDRETGLSGNVTNVLDLEAAEAAILVLETQVVIDQINALPTPGAIALTNENDVIAAEDALEALTDDHETAYDADSSKDIQDFDNAKDLLDDIREALDLLIVLDNLETALNDLPVDGDDEWTDLEDLFDAVKAAEDAISDAKIAGVEVEDIEALDNYNLLEGAIEQLEELLLPFLNSRNTTIGMRNAITKYYDYLGLNKEGIELTDWNGLPINTRDNIAEFFVAERPFETLKDFADLFNDQVSPYLQ